MPDTPRLTLPPELCILTVGALMPDWLAWLDHHAAHADGSPCQADIDASSVDEVDSAGLQLLVSLGNALEARGWTLRLHDVSDPLAQGCAQLGLGAWLSAHLQPMVPTGALS